MVIGRDWYKNRQRHVDTLPPYVLALSRFRVFSGFEIVFENLKKSGDLILYNTKGRIRHNIVRGGHVAKGRLVYSRTLWPCRFAKFTNA